MQCGMTLSGEDMALVRAALLDKYGAEHKLASDAKRAGNDEVYRRHYARGERLGVLFELVPELLRQIAHSPGTSGQG